MSSNAKLGEVLSGVEVDEIPPVGPVCPEAQPEPFLATVAEARRHLRIGKTQVFELLKSGVLERRKVNSSTRITMRSIRKLAGV